MKRHRGKRIGTGWFYCLLCAGLVMALCFALCKPAFDTNDDENIIAIASGAFTGTPYAGNGYTTYLYGMLLQGLYTLTSGLPWHTLVMYAVIWFSLAAMLRAIFLVCERHGASPLVGLGLFAALCGGVFAQYIATLQYTTTAAFAAAGGCGLLVAGKTPDRHPHRTGTLWIAAVLMLFAFCLRTESFWVAVPLMAGVGLAQSLQAKTPKMLFPMLLVVVGAILTGLLNLALYRANEPNWDAFRAYYDVRVQLLDYYNTDFMAKVATQTLGWPAETVRLIRNWYMLDDHMRLEPLSQLIAAVNAAQPQPGFLQLIKSTASILRRYPMFSYNMIGFGALGLWSVARYLKQRQWLDALVVVGTGAYLLLFITYFYGVLDRLPQRAAFSVACPVFVVLTLVCLPSLTVAPSVALQKQPAHKLQMLAASLAALCLCSAALTNVCWGDQLLPLRWKRNGQAARAALSNNIRMYADAQPSSVFITDIPQRYTPFTTTPFTAVNLLDWGHAMQGSDLLAQKYRVNGLTSLTTETLFDARVRLILSDGNKALFLEYLQALYENADLVTVDTGDGFTVYRLRRTE